MQPPRLQGDALNRRAALTGPIAVGAADGPFRGMTKADDPPSGSKPAEPGPKKPLPPAAKRALAEAAERRAKEQAQKPAAKEVGGPSGPEPTRYGDWEKKGLTSDF